MSLKSDGLQQNNPKQVDFSSLLRVLPFGDYLWKRMAARNSSQIFPEKTIMQLQWIVLTVISTGQFRERELDVLGEIKNGLAVDFVAGNMFWVQGDEILIAKMSHLEAGHKTIISDLSFYYINTLAVHPSRGLIYWATFTSIETVSMDGNTRCVLVNRAAARSLALDYEANDLYWADDYTGNIECVSLNGGAKRIVSARGEAGAICCGISLSGGRVYWTSYST
ncbi:hypothetical protein BV898_06544 [Hypsibius exemplaris]|uniref:DUF5050 domain-containing protein n=1 Tax=Hypsibius exemplaris TaxID=2072580 RepID=A0A1W0WW69_HYPEX|nr:hypothetical protein BV898_06544 [Hypsibius exemplaris]